MAREIDKNITHGKGKKKSSSTNEACLLIIVVPTYEVETMNCSSSYMTGF